MSISCYEYLSILEVGDKEEAPKDVTQNDYMEVLENVRGEIAKNHAEELAKTLNDASSAKTLKSLIMRYAAEYMSGKDYDRDELVEKIYQDMAGLGILTQYLYDPVVEEININSYDMIEVIYPNRTDFITGKDAFPTPEAALDIVKRMVRMGGKIIDAQTPQVDSFIGDGTRINATIPPIVPEDRGVVASIRKQNRNRITREMLENAGTASADELDFLTFCLCNHVSVGLAGGTGSGKTTVESFLLNEYILRNEDYNNRVYTIEDTQELNLLKYDDIHDRPARVVTMLTQETPVKITMMDLTKGALRYHPALIVPAEVRDGTVLQAVAAGQSGHTILTSFHADGAKDGYRRLVSLCHMADTTLTDEMLMEECVGSWPILVFAKQLKDKTRKIMEIFEATGQQDGHVIGTMLYRYKISETERDEKGRIVKIHGSHERVGCISPRLYSRLRDNGVPEKELKRLFPEAKPEEDNN